MHLQMKPCAHDDKMYLREDFEDIGNLPWTAGGGIWRRERCGCWSSPIYFLWALDQRGRSTSIWRRWKEAYPQKRLDLSSLFEIGGMMVADSILSGGAGFPCLLQAVFHCLITGIIDDEYIPPDMMPCKDDLPESLAYKELVEFVEMICYYDAIHV